MILASARLKAFVRFPPLRGMYQKEALARGATIIGCRSHQCHVVALEADEAIFNTILLPMQDLDPESAPHSVLHPWGSIFAPPPKKKARNDFDDCLCI